MSGVKLFVGSLPPGTTDTTLMELFAPYGAVSNCIMKTEQRYGFVFYDSLMEAQQAIEVLNGHALEGTNALVVKLADKQQQPPQGTPLVVPASQKVAGITPPPPPARHAGGPGGSDRIYVKGLPPGLTEETCREIFAQYGSVADTKVLVNDGISNDGTGQSVAIIKMGSEAEARWLVQNLNLNVPQGLSRAVEVSFAGSKNPQQQQQSQIVQGMVAPYPSPVRVPPRSQTAAWGAVRSQPLVHHVPAAQFVPMGGKGGGAAISAAVPSVVSMKSHVSAECKLYVKGLPLGADDAYLYKVFSPWARLLEAVALPKGDYCIGFVTCLTEAEAAECIMNVNGVALTDGTTLQVSVKTVKQ